MAHGAARVSEHLSEIEEADLPPAHAMRCPGRRPLTAKPRIATKSRFWTRRRIGRVALCVGVALALAILFVLPGLADAQEALTAENRELVELTARAANLAYREHQAYETFFAAAPQPVFPTFRHLPQRSLDIVVTVAVQAKLKAITADDFSGDDLTDWGSSTP